MKITPIIFAACYFLLSCNHSGRTSQLAVSDVQHTSIKNQGKVGTCWLFAETAWLEAMHLKATGVTLDLSEEYWGYLIIREQLLAGAPQLDIYKMFPSKPWAQFVVESGFVLHEELRPDVAPYAASYMAEAIAALNQKLSAGTLAAGAVRTEAEIDAALREAFGFSIAAGDSRLKPLNDLKGKTMAGSMVSIIQMLGAGPDGWVQWYFPVNDCEPNSQDCDSLALEVDPALRDRQERYLKAVMRAVNDHMPVILHFNISRSAYDELAHTWVGSRLDPQNPLRISSHAVIIDDYAVTGVPGVGSIGLGETSAAMKAKALEGTLSYFRTKNSWGTSADPAVPWDGYFTIDREYLTRPFAPYINAPMTSGKPFGLWKVFIPREYVVTFPGDSP